MKLQDILDKHSALKIYEERRRTDEYEELVFYKTELHTWNDAFVELLGPAVKPAGVRPTAEHIAMTKEQGGIRTEQTLFIKELEDVTFLAMFWPWQDNAHCTLKVAYIRK